MPSMRSFRGSRPLVSMLLAFRFALLGGDAGRDRWRGDRRGNWDSVLAGGGVARGDGWGRSTPATAGGLVARYCVLFLGTVFLLQDADLELVLRKRRRVKRRPRKSVKFVVTRAGDGRSQLDLLAHVGTPSSAASKAGHSWQQIRTVGGAIFVAVPTAHVVV
jgi:hypothetical protein